LGYFPNIKKKNFPVRGGRRLGGVSVFFENLPKTRFPKCLGCPYGMGPGVPVQGNFTAVLVLCFAKQNKTNHLNKHHKDSLLIH
jgi:hypothetical protein